MRTKKVSIVEKEGSPELGIVEEGGTARALIWPGMGAKHRSFHDVELPPGGRSKEQRHPGEAVYSVIRGEAIAIDLSDGSEHRIVKGAMVHIEPQTPYVLLAESSGAEIVGGPCPPDDSLYVGLR